MPQFTCPTFIIGQSVDHSKTEPSRTLLDGQRFWTNAQSDMNRTLSACQLDKIWKYQNFEMTLNVHNLNWRLFLKRRDPVYFNYETCHLKKEKCNLNNSLSNLIISLWIDFWNGNDRFLLKWGIFNDLKNLKKRLWNNKNAQSIWVRVWDKSVWVKSGRSVEWAVPKMIGCESRHCTTIVFFFRLILKNRMGWKCWVKINVSLFSFFCDFW